MDKKEALEFLKEELQQYKDFAQVAEESVLVATSRFDEAKEQIEKYEELVSLLQQMQEE